MNLLSTQWRVLAIVGLVAVSLTSAPRRPYSPHDKAFYADAQTVEFVLPGLTITVNSAAIAANGAITVTYTLTDPNWSAAGFGRDHNARHHQPELCGRGATQGPGRLYDVHHAQRDGHGAGHHPAAGRGHGRRGDVCRTGTIYIYVSHRGAFGIRCDRHAHYRHLRIAKLDRLQPGHQLRQRDLQFRSQRIRGDSGSRHHRDGQLQRLPRPVVGARRLAARD